MSNFSLYSFFCRLSLGKNRLNSLIWACIFTSVLPFLQSYNHKYRIEVRTYVLNKIIIRLIAQSGRKRYIMTKRRPPLQRHSTAKNEKGLPTHAQKLIPNTYLGGIKDWQIIDTYNGKKTFV